MGAELTSPGHCPARRLRRAAVRSVRTVSAHHSQPPTSTLAGKLVRGNPYPQHKCHLPLITLVFSQETPPSPNPAMRGSRLAQPTLPGSGGSGSVGTTRACPQAFSEPICSCLFSHTMHRLPTPTSSQHHTNIQHVLLTGFKSSLLQEAILIAQSSHPHHFALPWPPMDPASPKMACLKFFECLKLLIAC